MFDLVLGFSLQHSLLLDRVNAIWVFSPHASLCDQSAQTVKTSVFKLSDSVLARRLIKMAGMDFKCC